MGKHNRRGGNTKTASSAQAAQLLADSGYVVPLVTFDNFEPLATNVLEKQDANEDSFNPEFQIALKKVTKKDAQTREKGLKELLRLTGNASLLEDTQKSFKHFVAAFPKLSLDGTVAIRLGAIRVLGTYIKSLQKSSERYLKKVLPYVVFSMHDSFAQVVSGSKTMLMNCFPNEKYEIVMNMCKGPACGISLQLLHGTHPLLHKGEEEVEDQRSDRLTTQSLLCLKWSYDESISEEHRQQVLELFNRATLKRLLSSSHKVISGILNLSTFLLSVNIDEWKAVLESSLPTTALTYLGNDDRSVCRAAAGLILQMAKSKKLFTVMDINKIIVPRILSLLKQKNSYWNHISNNFVPLIEAMLAEKTEADGKALLSRISDAFFYGMPLGQKCFNAVWVNTFEKYIIFQTEWFATHCNKEELKDCMDESISKVWTALKFTLIWDDDSLLRKMIHLSKRIIRYVINHPEIILQLQIRMEDYLLNGLPETRVLIEEFLGDKVELVNINLIERLLRNECAGQKLIINILEKCNDSILNSLNGRIHLCYVLSTGSGKVEDEDGAVRMLKLLFKLTAMFKKPITDFLKTDDEIRSIQFLLAYTLVNEDERQSVAQFIDVERMLENSLEYCAQWNDLEHWNTLIEIAPSFPHFNFALDRVVDQNSDLMDQHLLISVLNKRGKQLSEDLRYKLVRVALKRLFEPNSELVSETVEAIILSEVDMKLVSGIIFYMVETAYSPQNSEFLVQRANCIVELLPLSSLPYFLITYADLTEKLSVLDKKYGLEILDAFECFASPTAIESLSYGEVVDSTTLSSHINCTMFILNYLPGISDDLIELAKPTILYAIAISSLISLNTITNGDLVDTAESLNSLINRNFQDKECFKVILLSECISLVAKGDITMCLLLTMRTLANGICKLKIQALLKNLLESLDSLGVSLCCAAICIQDAGTLCDKYCGRPVSLEQWINRFEVASSSKESASSLELLALFMSEGRVTFEDCLFTYNDSAENEGQNLFNCAFLRFLRHCCQFLSHVDSCTRDFICCALVASLESAHYFYRTSKSRSYLLFSGMAVKLFNECAGVINNIKSDVNLWPFKQEWSDFFCSSASNILLIWFLELSYSEGNAGMLPLQNALCLFVNHINEEGIRFSQLPPLFDVELDHFNYDAELQSLVLPLVTLMKSSSSNVQLAALKIMKLITVPMLRTENNFNKDDDFDIEKLSFDHQKTKELPVPFKKILSDTTKCCAIPALLLIWDCCINSLGYFERRERVEYSVMLSQYADQVMSDIFKILQVCNTCDVALPAEIVSIARPDYGNEIRLVAPRFAFHLLYNTCAELPKLVRQWFMELPRAAAKFIKTYISKHVSPLLWKAECDQFASRKMPRKLKVRLMRAARLIEAEYDLDDSVMTLTIEYPLDYPLSIPVIENEKAIVSREMRRKWLLQLTMFLAHQNGSVVDAVLMWTGNIEKHMDGAEDCTICMMTVHTNTCQLPRVRCKQCKKRFHSDCLYKWFDSSSQSTCPLCRASFR